MAITNVSKSRIRTEVAVFSNAVLATAVAAYNAYEVAQAADTTKTRTIRVINCYHDGANHNIVAENCYPETSDTAQVPELP